MCVAFNSLLAAAVQVMAQHRVYRTRARRRGVDGAPPVRRTGPAASSTSGRAAAQRRRRTLRSARENVIGFLEHLIRLGIIVATSPAGVSDVCRLRVLMSDLLDLGYTKATAFAVLMLDFARRSPDATADFVRQVRRITERRGEPLATQLLISIYRSVATSESWRCFWAGPTRLNMWSFFATVKWEELEHLGCVLAAVKTTRTTWLMDIVTQWKYLDTYTGFCMVRCVLEAGGVRLREADRAGCEMSLHTRLLAELLPFADARKRLMRCFPCHKTPGAAMLAFSYCEAVKVLKHERILGPLRQYDGHPELLAEALTSTACSRLLSRMLTLDPVSDEDASETELVNRLFPQAGRRRHMAQQTVKLWKKVNRAADTKRQRVPGQ